LSEGRVQFPVFPRTIKAVAVDRLLRNPYNARRSNQDIFQLLHIVLVEPVLGVPVVHVAGEAHIFAGACFVSGVNERVVAGGSEQ